MPAHSITITHIRGESAKGDVKCAVNGAHHHEETGVRVSIACFGDSIPDPNKATLSWDGGSAKVAKTKFTMNDPTWSVTGSLFFADVAIQKKLTFKFGDDFSGFDFELPKDQFFEVKFDQPGTADPLACLSKTKAVAEKPPVPHAPGQLKKALLVGCNYLGQNCALEGCINDVRNQKDILVSKFGFKDADIKLLTEDQKGDQTIPNKANILAGLEWLVKGTAEGDTIFFQYSGHGTQTPSDTEADGQNEAIVPVDVFDAEWPENLIMDDDLHNFLCDQVPDGVKCICIYDCCHSATMEDLKVTTDGDKTTVAPSNGDSAPAAKSRSLVPPPHVAKKIKSVRKASRSRGLISKKLGTKYIWVYSGCQDNQTSADAFIGGKHQGALSWALGEALKEASFNATYMELIDATKKKLADGGYSQVPALSSTDESLLKLHYMTCN
jgi:hypothetical protein